MDAEVVIIVEPTIPENVEQIVAILLKHGIMSLGHQIICLSCLRKQEGIRLRFQLSYEFASYGTPKGSCQKFSRGNCHASSSSSVVTELFLSNWQGFFFVHVPVLLRQKSLKALLDLVGARSCDVYGNI
ncbi:hypothetical protein OIU85_008798 [Salix viminalis]|uniref:Uncharacterized protein n=1 Tax=Salix viminalis TaxID=40686 RepID=A0A9Q0SIG0_SALVM|nr:hypothetical protein OIU85_008798 [Salix viminalis]